MKLDYYLSRFSGLKALYLSVREAFLKKGLVHHNWRHNLRDLARVVIVGESEKANMKIVLASVLLHDIGRLHPEVGSDHHEAGMKKAPEYLKRAGFSNEEISEILHCICMHELAHVFLKHRLYGSKVVVDLTIEEKADEQVKKWGFKVFPKSSSL